jgi:HTH-type transcriptional regulator, competence development regulator
MLAERLLELRKENKKTQQQVADYLKITRPAYTAYERGTRHPDYETLEKIADFFSVTTDYLLGRTDTVLTADHLKRISNNTDEPGMINKIKLTEEEHSLLKVHELAEKYGIEDMGFFDIEEWKNLSPHDIKMIEEHFKMIVKLAKERNKDKDNSEGGD